MSKRRKGHRARQSFAHAVVEEDEKLSFNPQRMMLAIASGQLAEDPDAEALGAVLVLDWLKKLSKEDPEFGNVSGSMPEDSTIREFMEGISEMESDPRNIPVLIDFLKGGYEGMMAPSDGEHR